MFAKTRLATEKSAHLAGSCCGLLIAARDKCPRLGILTSGIDAGDASILQLYFRHSRVVREMPLLPRHAESRCDAAGRLKSLNGLHKVHR